MERLSKNHKTKGTLNGGVKEAKDNEQLFCSTFFCQVSNIWDHIRANT